MSEILEVPHRSNEVELNEALADLIKKISLYITGEYKKGHQIFSINTIEVRALVDLFLKQHNLSIAYLRGILTCSDHTLVSSNLVRAQIILKKVLEDFTHKRYVSQTEDSNNEYSGLCLSLQWKELIRLEIDFELKNLRDAMRQPIQ